MVGQYRVVAPVGRGSQRGTYTLTLWDAERKRTIILRNVTFP